ncbi:MAG: L,D-transpeptidase family protein [Anaerolineales bacterium]
MDKKSSMASQFILPKQVLQWAAQALQRGDKQAARHWAQVAVAMAPEMEDPWLILAAVASPRASIAYLEQALEINPNSLEIRAALEQAHRQQTLEQTQPIRVKKRTASTGSEKPDVPMPVVHRRRRRGSSRISPQAPNTATRAAPARRFPIAILAPILVLMLVVCLVAVWAVWPEVGSLASAALASSPADSQGGQILFPSQAATANPATGLSLPAPLFTPSAFPSPTLAPIATSAPTLKPTATPVPTHIPTVPLPPTPKPTATPRPTSLPQPAANGNKLIVVSIHEQHLYAYQGGTLVYSFIVSTGSGNSTDTGSYTILDKIPNAYASTWNFYMPDWMGIYYVGTLEDGFHSLPLLPNGQRLWGDSIGTPVTYGCIVLGIQDAQELYNWANVGTSVQINP